MGVTLQVGQVVYSRQQPYISSEDKQGRYTVVASVGVVMFVCEGVREDGRVEWGEGLNVALDLVPHPFNLT